MTRYATRPHKACTDEDCLPDGWCEGVEVEVTGDRPTGVLDNNGYEIWEVAAPAGFDLRSMKE